MKIGLIALFKGSVDTKLFSWLFVFLTWRRTLKNRQTLLAEMVFDGNAIRQIYKKELGENVEHLREKMAKAKEAKDEKTYVELEERINRHKSARQVLEKNEDTLNEYRQYVTIMKGLKK